MEWCFCKSCCCFNLAKPSDAFCFVAAIEDLDVFHHLFPGIVPFVVVGDLGHDLCQVMLLVRCHCVAWCWFSAGYCQIGSGITDCCCLYPFDVLAVYLLLFLLEVVVLQWVVTHCDLAVSRAWDVVMLFSACLCVVVVGLTIIAKDSLSTFQSHVTLFSIAEACGAVSSV